MIPVRIFVVIALLGLLAGSTACGGKNGISTSPFSGNANLSSLEVSVGNLFPAFDEDTTLYTVTVGFMGSALEVTPFGADSASIVTVNGTPTASGNASSAISLEEGSANTITVTVTNGSTSKTYLITVIRQSVATLLEEEILHASDAEASDYFGISIALDTDTVVVGASGEGNGAGAAYVLTRSGSIWTEQQKLVASDSEAGDGFGTCVAIEGDTVVVGAPGEETQGTNAGALYLFTRSGTTWTQEEILYASDADQEDSFGRSVALDDHTVVVGACPEYTGGQVSGAAYVFTKNGSVWMEEQKLVSSDPELDDEFGWSVALDGDTVVVGAYGENTAGAWESGAAYVFTRSPTTWMEEQKLVASDPVVNAWFGCSVDLVGDTVVVGASPTSAFSVHSGAAYVFTRSGDIWTEQQKLVASDATVSDWFGASVAIDGNSLVVGAFGVDTQGGNAGAAYLFTWTGFTWTEAQKIEASDAEFHDLFGNSVALDGDTVAVGAYQEDTGGANAGAAYVIR